MQADFAEPERRPDGISMGRLLVAWAHPSTLPVPENEPLLDFIVGSNFVLSRIELHGREISGDCQHFHLE